MKNPLQINQVAFLLFVYFFLMRGESTEFYVVAAILRYAKENNFKKYVHVMQCTDSYVYDVLLWNGSEGENAIVKV
jgi:hypothetical protein